MSYLNHLLYFHIYFFAQLSLALVPVYALDSFLHPFYKYSNLDFHLHLMKLLPLRIYMLISNYLFLLYLVSYQVGFLSNTFYKPDPIAKGNGKITVLFLKIFSQFVKACLFQKRTANLNVFCNTINSSESSVFSIILHFSKSKSRKVFVASFPQNIIPSFSHLCEISFNKKSSDFSR